MAKANPIAFRNVLMIGLIFIAVLGFADWIAIQYVYTHGWTGAEAFSTSFWIMAWVALGFVSATYYFVSKDRSETIGIIIFLALLILAGLEDLSFYGARYIMTGEAIDAKMCWFTTPINFVSTTFLNETCVSPLGLGLNVLFFGVIGFVIARWLVDQPW